MNKALSRRISIFLTVDSTTINDYFNPHDPAPIYKRQLRHDFVQYIRDSVTTYKKYSTLRYKINYKPEDHKLVEPFMHAVRRHFYIREQLKKMEFEKFKKRNFRLLALSILVVMFCQGIVPIFLSQEHRIHSALSNSIDVFSWVILWQPFERLVFYWNPFLKDLSLLHKLANAEIIAIEANQEEVVTQLKLSA